MTTDFDNILSGVTRWTAKKSRENFVNFSRAIMNLAKVNMARFEIRGCYGTPKDPV
jgi:hypothetical protein